MYYNMYIYVDFYSTIFVFTFDELARLGNKINKSWCLFNSHTLILSESVF